MSASNLNKSQALVQSVGPLAANRTKVLSQQLQEAIQSFALQPKAGCKGSLDIWWVTCRTDGSPEWLDILWALVQEKRPSSAGDGKPEGNEVPWVRYSQRSVVSIFAHMYISTIYCNARGFQIHPANLLGTIQKPSPAIRMQMYGHTHRQLS